MSSIDISDMANINRSEISILYMFMVGSRVVGGGTHLVRNDLRRRSTTARALRIVAFPAIHVGSRRGPNRRPAELESRLSRLPTAIGRRHHRRLACGHVAGVLAIRAASRSQVNPQPAGMGTRLGKHAQPFARHPRERHTDRKRRADRHITRRLTCLVTRRTQRGVPTLAVNEEPESYISALRERGQSQAEASAKTRCSFPMMTGLRQHRSVSRAAFRADAIMYASGTMNTFRRGRNVRR
jgi:hypothetical protein